ncbi:MAG: zinc-ribbon domain-containing protein [Candidatus Bathyarchaeota archaeon]|nr:zinc-ribbon domain-containing protein [Candidatus Bathyarchaeota archaeon]MDH5494156.1 zinc-ribbon domain-containing protein [Candidatus Bathyarchaeota archaeon]
MVYCSKCGFKNEDDAEVCAKCGASLQVSRLEKRRVRREKRVEDECFGLPHGGAIVGLLIGIIIILWGLTQLPGLLPSDFEFWPWIIVVFGVLIVAGALYGFTRRR